MPNYRRACVPGGTFFLTIVTHQRMRLFDIPTARRCLRESIALTRRDRPFELIAAVLLPEHLHLLINLPTGDADFSTRVAAFKGRFTRRWLACGGTEQSTQSVSRARQHYRGFWQKRFWEHHVRDEDDFDRCCDYIHYNPVKHGHVACPHAWPWSTFQRFVRDQRYEPSWCCACMGSRHTTPPTDIAGAEPE